MFTSNSYILTPTLLHNYADEMGLGKTLQTISLLAYLREARGVKGPHLVIVPKSVVGNWIKEFRKWCPSIKAVRMGGTKDERMKARETFLKPDASSGKYKFDALVCSYEAVLKEKTSLGRIPWNYLIIDEVRIMVVKSRRRGIYIWYTNLFSHHS